MVTVRLVAETRRLGPEGPAEVLLDVIDFVSLPRRIPGKRVGSRSGIAARCALLARRDARLGLEEIAQAVHVVRGRLGLLGSYGSLKDREMW